MTWTWNPNGGSFNPALVDRIERWQVTEATVDKAIERANHYPAHYHVARRTASQRAKTRRNIALGINCGSYREWQYPWQEPHI